MYKLKTFKYFLKNIEKADLPFLIFIKSYLEKI